MKQLQLPQQYQTPLRRSVLIALWVLTLITFPIWIHFSEPAWDYSIYMRAVHALQLGHDPYADAIAIQNYYHEQHLLHPDQTIPATYSYVYSPMTLPILRLVGATPLLLSGAIYWGLYIAGVFATILVCMSALEESERPSLVYLAPLAVFFPGLLASDNILSGNVAYILYGLVLAAAIYGWRRNRWLWFYLAVLGASCLKAPLLSLIAIPVLSARRQWIPAGITGLAGCVLFAMQPHLWRTLFQHFLTAVDLQFKYNRDFGISPAGIFGGILFDHHIPYSPGSFIFYLCYAVPLFALLFHLSRRYLRGEFTLQQWIPVLLVGVILLNPRLIEYDVAPLALPLAIILWRICRSFGTPPRNIVYFALIFLSANLIAGRSWEIMKLTDCAIIVLLFIGGSWNLIDQAQNRSPISTSDSDDDTPALEPRLTPQF